MQYSARKKLRRHNALNLLHHRRVVRELREAQDALQNVRIMKENLGLVVNSQGQELRTCRNTINQLKSRISELETKKKKKNDVEENVV